MTTTQTQFVQQPNDVAIYEMDYAAKYLAGTQDTAGNLLAFDSDPGIVANAQTAIGSPVPGGILKIQVSGGTNGGAYKITARIGTTQGRQKEWEITVLVRET